MEETKKTRGGSRPGAGRPKGIKKPYKIISVNMPVEYGDRLKAAAEKEGLSVSKFIQKAVDAVLES